MRKKYKDQSKVFLLLILPIVLFLAAGLTVFLTWEEHEEKRKQEESLYEETDQSEAFLQNEDWIRNTFSG